MRPVIWTQEAAWHSIEQHVFDASQDVAVMVAVSAREIIAGDALALTMIENRVKAGVIEHDFAYFRTPPSPKRLYMEAAEEIRDAVIYRAMDRAFRDRPDREVER
jgi:hypothetical protein